MEGQGLHKEQGLRSGSGTHTLTLALFICFVEEDHSQLDPRMWNLTLPPKEIGEEAYCMNIAQRLKRF